MNCEATVPIVNGAAVSIIALYVKNEEPDCAGVTAFIYIFIPADVKDPSYVQTIWYHVKADGKVVNVFVIEPPVVSS